MGASEGVAQSRAAASSFVRVISELFSMGAFKIFTGLPFQILGGLELWVDGKTKWISFRDSLATLHIRAARLAPS